MIGNFVTQHEPEIIASFQRLLAIESVKSHPVPGGPFGAGPAEALSYVLQLAENRHLTTKNVNGYAGHVEYGTGDEYIAVLAHLDVVPAGEGWTYPPFGGVIDQGRIYGRGAIDDKGPAMSALWALFALQEAGFVPRRKIRLIFGLDEESDWQCVEHYFRYESKPIGGFTPDAQFPLIYAEKGMATLCIEVPAEADSLAAQIQVFSGGTRYNMVPKVARATVDCHSETAARELLIKFRKVAKDLQVSLHSEVRSCFVDLTVEGRSAHASRPEAGINAIVQLAQLLGTATVSNCSMWRSIGSWDYFGRALGIDHDDGETGPLTMNVGTGELRDGVYRFHLNLRYPADQSIDELLTSMANYLPDRWRITLVEHMDPLRVDPNSTLVQTLMDVYKQFFKEDIPPLTTGGVTYARAIPNAVAFGARFPEKPSLAHQADEYWEIDDFFRTIEIYAEAMTRLANAL
ncbi:hypothetical protein SD51_11935 [Alicyclobacillus tengchongensis]|nr:hypothetical protein SD51_11935 [Alicyclobacillus tengchongensis]